MTESEIALKFDCQGSPLVGVLHLPERHTGKGVVMVDAGGPQYRVGVARQLLLWARELTNAGIAVLRFDYRGFGDSGGEYIGFEHIDADIKSAVDTISEQISNLDEIVLWGECNAASAIMMYAWRDPRVTRLVLQNPWIRSEETQAKTYIKHYYWYRLKQRSFWQKLYRLRFNPATSVNSMVDLFKKSLSTPHDDSALHRDDIDLNLPYQVRMREGLSRYHGRILLFMSGRSLIGKELDEAVGSSSRWKEIVASSNIDRIDMRDADHTFSRRVDREKLVEVARNWLHSS